MNATLAPTLPPWLDKTAYPFTPRAIDTPEGSLSYLDEGRGPAVLLVHGTPSWSFEFRDVVTRLRATHRCVAPDHLGFGLSDKHTRALRVADHARRLRELVTRLDLRDLTLVVHDFGGPIGLPVALDLPERVARVVVLNTWMWSNADDPAVARLDRVIRSPLGRVMYRWLNASPRLLMPSLFGDRAKLTGAVHAQYLGPFRARADREGTYAMALELAGANAHNEALWARRARLAEKPLDIVWGSRDPAFTARHLARWREAFSHATVTELDGVGHFVAEEAPEDLARVIAR
ncbi:MAG: alpha/beta fold hydrolase [Polyangiales bacterium]